MRLQFGPFTLDSGTRQVLRDRREVHLSPKAFELLCHLVEHRPRVVEKTDLLGRIWPGTFVVDASLNVLVGEIRRALGDNPRSPRYVRTVHGVGYAFCSEVRELDDGSAAAGVLPCWLISADRTFRLREGPNIIGRDPGCSVWLDAPSVSRRHARLTVDSASRRAVLEDLKSTNGCYVRGAAIDGPVELTDGEAIAIGSIELRACLWSAESGAKTARIARPPRTGTAQER